MHVVDVSIAPHGFVEVLQLLQVLGEALDQEEVCVSVWRCGGCMWWMWWMYMVDACGGCVYNPSRVR